MIDLDPNNKICIYSTLKYTAEHAQKHGTKYPIITFDQPIIQTEPTGGPITIVIVRIGAFHTKTSFPGSIVHVMAEIGLKCF